MDQLILRKYRSFPKWKSYDSVEKAMQDSASDLLPEVVSASPKSLGQIQKVLVPIPTPSMPQNMVADGVAKKRPPYQSELNPDYEDEADLL